MDEDVAGGLLDRAPRRSGAAVDANVLLYAYDPRAPITRPRGSVAVAELSSGRPVRLALITLLAFVRIATDRRVFTRPLSRRGGSWRGAERGAFELRAIAPLHVAAYIRTHPRSVPTVKQHLAAIRGALVLAVNPAASVRGPKHVVTKGATPAETRALLDRIDTGTLVGLRDRALLSVLVYSFARVSAAVGMRRQDYFRQGTRGWLRLHEKGGKRHDVPAHHRAEEAVEAYLDAGGIEDAKAPLFQSVDRSGRLSGRPLARRAVLAMIDQEARGGGGAAGVDVLPHVSGDRDQNP